MTHLTPMTDNEYQRFWDNAVPLYADEKVGAGHWSPENAMSKSLQDHTALLPDGIHTPDHHLFTIWNDNDKNVGYLMVAIKDFGAGKQAYIYKIFIWEGFRRRGYAKAAFLALEKIVADWGYDALLLHVFGDNSAALKLYTQLGYITTDVNMAKTVETHGIIHSKSETLPLTHLTPMTQNEYQQFWDNAIPLFADEKVRAGHWSAENALNESTQAFSALLPDGIATPNHHLFTIRNKDEDNIGYLFVAVKDFGAGDQVYIYEVFIWEAFRRRGYAKGAFLALEKVVDEWGYDTLLLHVFGHNVAAIALYKTLGYLTTDVNMAKKITR